MTAPFISNTTLHPIFIKKSPMILFLPNISSKKNPTTVGGSTSGSEKIQSRSVFPCFIETTSLAASSPNTNVIIVAIIATLSDINNGE